jgi:hypothetical protein
MDIVSSTISMISSELEIIGRYSLSFFYFLLFRISRVLGNKTHFVPQSSMTYSILYILFVNLVIHFELKFTYIAYFGTPAYPYFYYSFYKCKHIALIRMHQPNNPDSILLETIGKINKQQIR